MTEAEQAMPEAAQRVAEKLQAWCATLPEEEQEVMDAILRLAAEQGEVTGYVDARVAGAVAAVAMLLGGAGIFGATREASPAAGASTTSSRTAEGVTPRGGLAEQYQEQQQETTAREAAQVTTRGGLAEQYAEQAAEARESTERESRPGGLDEVRPTPGT